MTYSLIARCPSTGQLGIAIATYTIVVGQYCDGAKANTGVSITQAYPKHGNNSMAVELLRQGFAASVVVDLLQKNDEFDEYRQIGVLDRHGKTGVHTGSRARQWAGHVARNGLIAMGNALLGPQVLEGIVRGFDERPADSLSSRLLRGLEGARDAGGQHNGTKPLAERSAALVVVGREEFPELNLRVDLHDQAVDELRRIFDRYQLYEDYYRRRDVDPRDLPPQEVLEQSFAHVSA